MPPIWDLETGLTYRCVEALGSERNGSRARRRAALWMTRDHAKREWLRRRWWVLALSAFGLAIGLVGRLL